MSCFLSKLISHRIGNSKGSRQKRDTEQEKQRAEAFHSDKYDIVDMMMNPEKVEQYQNSVEMTKQDIR